MISDDGRPWPQQRPPARSLARSRMPLLLVIAASVAAVAVAVSAVGVPTPGLRFAQAGHWIAQPAQGLIAHVDGATKRIDATARVPGLPAGSQVVQGADTGYVVGSNRIVEFGKSTLSVRRTVDPPVDETPLAIEAAGGPYLIYRQAGQVVRFGPSPATIPAGGALGRPVVTADGTLWAQRTETGVFCALPAEQTTLSCPGAAPQGHTGQLALVRDQPVFVDTTQDALRPLTDGGLGEPVSLGVDVPERAAVAPQDAAGRLAILDGPGKRLHRVDTAGLTGRKAAPPVSTGLPRGGDYRGPDSAGGTVVLLDVANNDLLTYRGTATTPQRTPVPDESGEPRLFRGEDGNVYVDGAQGRHVMVVDDSGGVSEVPVSGTGPRPDRDARPLAQPQQVDPRPNQPEQADAPLPPVAQAPPRAPIAQPRPPQRREPPQQPRRQPPPEPTPRPDPEPEPQPEPPRRPAPDRPADNPRPTNPAPSPRPDNPDRPTPRPPKPKPPKPKPIPASPPGAPTGFGALLDADNGNASISWDAPPANGSPITAYHLSWSEGSATYTGSQTWVIRNLGTNGPYELRLTAENAAGVGPAAVTTTLSENNNIGNNNGTGNTINVGQGALPPGTAPGGGPRAVGRARPRRGRAGHGTAGSRERR